MYELFVGHPLFEGDFAIREYMAAGTPLRLDEGQYSHHMKPFLQILHVIPDERPSVYKLKVQLAELNASFKKHRDREQVSLHTEARTFAQRPSLQIPTMSLSERSHNPVRVPGATGLGNQEPNLPTEHTAPPEIIAEPLPDAEAARPLTSSPSSNGSERANQRARYQHTGFSRGPRHTPTLDFTTISLPLIPVPAMDGPWETTTSEGASIAIDRSSLGEERDPAAAVGPNHDGTENINQPETSNHVDETLVNDSSASLPSSYVLSEILAPITSRPGSLRINEQNRIPGGLFEDTASAFSLNNNRKVISALVNGLKLKSTRKVQITSGSTYQVVAISPSCETIALITSEAFLIYSVRKSDGGLSDPKLVFRGGKDRSYATALDLSPGGSTRADSTDCVSNFKNAALGDQILCIASDKAVTLRSTATGRRVQKDFGVENTACLGISFDNSTLAMGLATGSVCLRSLADLTSPCSIIPGTGDKVTCLAFSRCSKYLSVCTLRNVIRTYRININTAEYISTYDHDLTPNRWGKTYLGITGLSL